MLAGAAAVAAEPASTASARPPVGRFSLSASGEYSAGGYGGEAETRVFYLPFTARYRHLDLSLTPYAHDHLELRLTLAYVRVEGPGDVVLSGGMPIARRRGAGDGGTGSGGMPGSGGSGSGAPMSSAVVEGETRVVDGFGDIFAGARYTIDPPPGRMLPSIDLAGTVKIPTASASDGLGTGKVDVTLWSELWLPVGDFSLRSGGGYRFMGGEDLSNRWLASAGCGYRFGDSLSAGLDYDFREAAVTGVENAHELVPYVSLRLGRHVRLEPYAVAGLSDASPDWGAGVTLRFSVSVVGGVRPSPRDPGAR
ncbi:MAG TPA: hypothetical protein VIY27_06225 [Myxococcota bacterium]